MKTISLLFVGFLTVGCGSASEPVAPTAPAAPVAVPTETPAADELLVSGTISAPEGAPEAKAVFVSLKSKGRPGPPLAAKRLEPGPFPLSFTLTAADRPMANGPLPESFMVKATLDVDGDPMKKSDTDLEVIVPGRKGATGLTLTLAPRAK